MVFRIEMAKEARELTNQDKGHVKEQCIRDSQCNHKCMCVLILFILIECVIADNRFLQIKLSRIASTTMPIRGHFQDDSCSNYGSVEVPTSPRSTTEAARGCQSLAAPNGHSESNRIYLSS